MAKKNWTYIKRGLITDPKHRIKMGECIWLYLYIIDRADWDTGIVHEWKDADEAEAMQMTMNTLRDQRQKLERLGYINCKHAFQHQELTICNWLDPHKSLANHSDVRASPSPHSDAEASPSDLHSDPHSDAHPSSQDVTPTYSPLTIKPLSTRETPKIPGIESAIFQGRPVEQADIDVSGASWFGREKMPEPIRELLDVYVELTGQKPTKRQHMDWLATGQEWLELGVATVDLREAYKKANPENGRGFAVVRPGSLTATAGACAGERRKRSASANVQRDPMWGLKVYLAEKAEKEKQDATNQTV